MQQETGRDKIQKICDILKKETLEPAKQQAQEIIENANLQKEQIIAKANEEAKRIIVEAEKNISDRRKAFESSMQLAGRQTIDEIKQTIEEKLLSNNIAEFAAKIFTEKESVVRLINAVIEALNKEGTSGDLSVYVAKVISADEITSLLSKTIIERLKERQILIGDFKGGIKVKIHDANMTIDISDETIKDLLMEYVRMDFRRMIFNI
jgi:V/A-type H+/Na+-transporting ATPase subunit E